MAKHVARCLARVLDGASLKGICHDDRATFALLSEALRRRFLLDRALVDAGLGITVSTGGPAYAEALLAAHELLFGRGLRGKRNGLDRSPAVRSKLLRWQADLLRSSKQRQREDGLRKALAGFAGSAESDQAPLPRLPRYARVNTLRAATLDVVSALQREGYQLQPTPALSGKTMAWSQGVAHAVTSRPDNGAMWIDETVRDLLVLPAGLELHRHQLVSSGTLILQDKASCFTPAALAPRAGEAIIDCCAAPGNKTSQLAALAAPGAMVVAVERNPGRAKTLRNRLAAAHVGSAVRVVEGDFLSIQPTDAPWRDATALLLDPSCSGSGIVERRGDNELQGAQKPGGMPSPRLRALAALQVRLLLHALKLPQVRRVAYSTCSIHPLENEVVALTVARHPEVVRAGWTIVPALPSWPCRGMPLSDEVRSECSKMVRSGPEWLTNGFFVAVFERPAEGLRAAGQ